MKKMICFVILLIIGGVASAADYNLKRATLTWSDGGLDDTALGTFRAIGSMNISDMVITQSLTFCDQSTCDVLADNTSGTIASISINNAMVTVSRNADQLIENLTILSLSPNIITMFVYADGTVETHEWEPINISTSIGRQEPENMAISTGADIGSIGYGIADHIKKLAK